MFTHHQYNNSNLEFREIRDLLTDSFAATGKLNCWTFCRLENWRYRIHSLKLREDPLYLSSLAHLWRHESGNLIGVTICEGNLNAIHIISHIEHKYIEREILKWIEENWSQDKILVMTYVDASDDVRKDSLLSHGYRFEREADYMRLYDLSKVKLDCDLEAGYCVKDIITDRNFRARATTIHKAFTPDYEPRTDDLYYWESTRGAPGYRPRLELAAIGQNGEHAAACLGWVDEGNRLGEVEPVGTHPDFQRRGFARAVIIECFKRMKDMGISHAYISSAPEPDPSNRLYEKFGPVEKVVQERWVKDFKG